MDTVNMPLSDVSVGNTLHSKMALDSSHGPDSGWNDNTGVLRMTHGHNRKRMRTLTVAGARYHWRFRPGAHGSTLLVQRAVRPGQRLQVELPEWHDPWLNLSGFHQTEAGELVLHSDAQNEPALITPGFVRAAVDFALARGWAPDRPGPIVQVVYRQKAFSWPRT